MLVISLRPEFQKTGWESMLRALGKDCEPDIGLRGIRGIRERARQRRYHQPVLQPDFARSRNGVNRAE